MSEDFLQHFTSNSSNQSDQSLPSKIAKLEARMVGKTSTAVVSTLQISSVSSSSDISAKFGANVAGGICAESLESSDPDEDDSEPHCFLRKAKGYATGLQADTCLVKLYLQRAMKEGRLLYNQ